MDVQTYVVSVYNEKETFTQMGKRKTEMWTIEY